MKKLTHALRGMKSFPLRLLVVVALLVPALAVSSPAFAATSASDNFARANGSLGPNWTALSDGPLAISSQMVIGTNAGGDSGDIRTAETYTSDQYSTVQVTSTALTGSQWIGPMVRVQGTGTGLYVGIYFWNSGKPELMLFKRIAGAWTQLGSTYASGALTAGTQLTLTAAGSTLTFSQNGVARITTTDTSLTGGAPGIMANGTATAANWSGGNVLGTDSIGGTASGLTGTVVLQDNGGDNLTVTANGSFTFPTLLSAGESYNVTVLTNPTGQTCAATNGTGTVASTNVSNVGVSCTTASGSGSAGSGSVSDNFAWANGSLGPNWTALSDGPLAISSQMVIGTNAGGDSGDIRTAETYTSDQYSTVQVTSTALTGSQWIGPMVRVQGTGTGLYVGIYFWNSGKPELMLFKRIAGAWTQLGSTYASGALTAGTQLTLTAAGSTLTFSQNGVARVTTTDTSLTGGAPGIMANGTATAANWSGGNVGGSTPVTTTSSVGGSITGLTGTVVLQDNGGDNLTLSANGSFTFPTALASGQAYNATVLTNPTGQTCTVTNGTGTTGSANITNITVTCTTPVPKSTVGGSITGLTGTVVLQDNGGDNLTLTANGSFTFPTALASGQTYNATVLTNPTGQTCTLTNGTGTTASTNITNITVTCTAPVIATSTVGGSITGLTGTVVLQDNGGDNLTLTANGSFTFPTALASGQTYNATVLTNPTGQTCTLTNATGTVASTNITNITVTCTTTSGSGGSGSGSVSDNFARANGSLGPNWTALSDGPLAISSQMVIGTNAGGNSGDIRTAETYTSDQYSTVQVTSTPLTGSQWIGPMVRAQGTGTGLYVGIYFWNSGSPELMLFKRISGAWTQLGSSYASGALAAGTQLTLTAAASTLTFSQNGVARITTTDTSLTGGAPGIMANGDATAANWSGGNVGGSTPVTGTTSSVGGTITGLTGTVVLQDNGGDNLTLTANGTFTFPTALTSGQTYNATVLTNPTGQTCTLTNATGTVAITNITNITVTCTTPVPGTVSVGGTITGLAGTVVLQDNGGDNLTMTASGTFTFATLLASGQAYNATVVTNPTGQSCTVTNGTGTVASTNITNVAVSCATSASTVSDNFARANGALGPNWTALSQGPLAISSQMVIGTTSGNSGDIRTAETYTSDQYSTIQVTATPLTGNQWIGPMVRVQGTGTGLYVGIYSWNSGTPEMMLFKQVSGAWTQLGSYASGALAAGTQLTLTAVGPSLAFSENGVIRISVSDTTFTGGAPGIMANGAATAANWSGGDSGFQVDYLNTDSTGIRYYDTLSDNNGYGPQALRVLQPTHPAAGVAHNFLFVLPVEAGLGNEYGDGLATLQALDVQDQYNVTIVEPTFYYQPWYANNPTDANLQYETFMTNELVPWVDANLASSRTEQNWLIGFSKSGYGAQDLILKHPNLFAAAATWDFPADMSTSTEYAIPQAYGTEANFAANYQLTSAFLNSYKTPFLTQNRIWIAGYSLYGTDISDYNTLLTSEGILHTMGPSVYGTHTWTSGWMPAAVAALYQDSLSLPPGP